MYATKDSRVKGKKNGTGSRCYHPVTHCHGYHTVYDQLTSQLPWKEKLTVTSKAGAEGMFYCGFLQYTSTVAEFVYLVGIILQILTVTDSTLRTGYKNYKKKI